MSNALCVLVLKDPSLKTPLDMLAPLEPTKDSVLATDGPEGASVLTNSAKSSKEKLHCSEHRGNELQMN